MQLGRLYLVLTQILASFWSLFAPFSGHSPPADHAIPSSNLSSGCLGPPYLYVTTHHEVGNILKYTRDGCLLMEDVLIGGDIGNPLVELRTMIFGQHKKRTVLFVANAVSNHSSLLMYDGVCDGNGRRKYLGTVVTTDSNPGANHCYGVCFDPEGHIYASFQHTDNVLRFDKTSFRPMRLPYTLRNQVMTNLSRPYFAGTFVQFGQPKIHDIPEQGIRSLAFINGHLWVCNENLNGIVIVDGTSGATLNIIPMINPIGMHYVPQLGLVFVGSKNKHWRGAVYSIDVNSFLVLNKYTSGRMNHPTGITHHGDDLFVGEIEQGIVMRFSINSTALLDIVVDYPPGEVEQLLMSDC